MGKTCDMKSSISIESGYNVSGKRIAVSSGPIAVPSWVTAGTIADNAAFVLNAIESCSHQNQALQHPISEIGLCFFETASCLAYTEEDLPATLAELPFSWHVHLPSDLPWHDGGAAVARIALELMDKVAFLGVKHAVLHPPILPSIKDGGASLLRNFMKDWTSSGRSPHDIHLENIHGHDLASLWDCIPELGCRVCLDTGHLITYKQDALLALLMEQNTASYNKECTQDAKGPFKHIGMLHLCATAPSGRHAPLSSFTPQEQALVASLCRAVPSDCTLMLELFKWEHIVESLPLLLDWLAE